MGNTGKKYEPLIPPLASKPHFVGPTLHAWICTPLSVVTFKTERGMITEEDASLMAGPVMDKVNELNIDGEPVAFYHDWRNSKGLLPKARETIVGVVKDLGKDKVRKIRVETGAMSGGRKLIAETIMMTLRILGHDVAVTNGLADNIEQDNIRIMNL